MRAPIAFDLAVTCADKHEQHVLWAEAGGNQKDANDETKNFAMQWKTNVRSSPVPEVSHCFTTYRANTQPSGFDVLQDTIQAINSSCSL